MLEKKKKYAEFLITKCLSMNPGEPLLLSYSSSHEEFVKIVKEVAKNFGITEIYDVCFDPDKTREILLNSTVEEIKHHPYFDRKIIKDVYDKGGSFLHLSSYEPSKLSDISLEKINAMDSFILSSQQDAKKARAIYKYPLCIAAVATKPWADKLFPEDDDNLDKLWNIIFELTLINKENPKQAWDEKISLNSEKRDLLNELKLTKLKYKNNLGTDLEIGLPKSNVWIGTSKISFDGQKKLIVNMPTEEIYTAPDKNNVNGVVCSSRPLVVKGNIIDKFKITFKDGKIEKVWVSNNEELFLNLIEEYEGMKYLGECSLVDYNSPVSNTNLLYNLTLIDENASCHLALGMAYPKCVSGGQNMKAEQLEKAGINICKNHVDFMIGTKDLSIIGTDIYGKEIPIFIDGNFAIDEVKKFIKERKN